jgi:hypothetical protein
MGNTLRATTHPATKKFMTDLITIFKKHNMAIVPTYENEISFHDPMRVVPFDANTEKYIVERVAVEED